jgi:hypothetical protein
MKLTPILYSISINAAPNPYLNSSEQTNALNEASPECTKDNEMSATMKDSNFEYENRLNSSQEKSAYNTKDLVDDIETFYQKTSQQVSNDLFDDSDDEKSLPGQLTACDSDDSFTDNNSSEYEYKMSADVDSKGLNEKRVSSFKISTPSASVDIIGTPEAISHDEIHEEINADNCTEINFDKESCRADFASENFISSNVTATEVANEGPKIDKFSPVSFKSDEGYAASDSNTKDSFSSELVDSNRGKDSEDSSDDKSIDEINQVDKGSESSEPETDQNQTNTSLDETQTSVSTTSPTDLPNMTSSGREVSSLVLYFLISFLFNIIINQLY